MPESIQVRNLCIGDIKTILEQSRREGWVSGIKEFFQILKENSAGTFAVAMDKHPIGFITTYIYQNSAWIGNFIVAPEYRGRGYGRQLLKKALSYLEYKKINSIFLAAAPKAVNLYRQYNFQEVCTLNRWKKVVLPTDTGYNGMGAKSCTIERIVDFDAQCWQEYRAPLIKGIWSRRHCFEHSHPYGFIMFSRVGKYQVIGPWEVDEKSVLVAEKLLQRVYTSVRKKETFLLDVPANNPVASPLLAYHGFDICGSTTLMHRGELPDIQWDKIFALGSLGAMG